MSKSQIIGLDKFRTGLEVALSAQRKQLDGALTTLADELVSEIQANCPVLTGALKSSIRAVQSPTSSGQKIRILVGDAKTFYAAFVEFGTSHSPARPFVRPAVEKMRSRAPDFLKAVIAQTWEGK